MLKSLFAERDLLNDPNIPTAGCLVIDYHLPDMTGLPLRSCAVARTIHDNIDHEQSRQSRKGMENHHSLTQIKAPAATASTA